MKTYNIAELKVNMNCEYNIMKKRSLKYLSKSMSNPDITLKVPNQIYIHPPQNYQHLSCEELELVLMCAQFAQALLSFQGFLLHASAIEFENQAILFSAGSQIGKSTHTRLWQSYYGKENVQIINDDKPAIRLIDQTFYAYGNPFSGNSEENKNIKVPLQTIVFLERSETNSIEKITPNQALPLLMKQTLRPFRNKNNSELLLTLFDQLLKQIPIYLLHCNMEKEVVPFVKNYIFKSYL